MITFLIQLYPSLSPAGFSHKSKTKQTKRHRSSCGVSNGQFWTP
ncbi:hypothetical protein DLM_4401 [Aquitalea magnusonii]|uniref:Uncharacterized protein n=1 Tax=Aquitalea magnusonii TaxID=332411 RepID=A0A3G9GR89_9NEIS|nr:hypothetical protein DLM_4401 [Aquitalea magnusonii]